MITKRQFLLLSSAALVSACASTPSEPPAPLPFVINNVSVSVRDGAEKGLFAEDAELRDATVNSIRQQLLGMASGLPSGGPTATLQVEIAILQLRSAGTRSFGGVNQIFANVQVSKGSEVLKPAKSINHSNQAVNNTTTINGAPIGIFINLARNAGAADSGADVSNLISGFTDDVKDWLQS